MWIWRERIEFQIKFPKQNLNCLQHYPIILLFCSLIIKNSRFNEINFQNWSHYCTPLFRFPFETCKNYFNILLKVENWKLNNEWLIDGIVLQHIHHSFLNLANNLNPAPALIFSFILCFVYFILILHHISSSFIIYHLYFILHPSSSIIILHYLSFVLYPSFFIIYHNPLLFIICTLSVILYH